MKTERGHRLYFPLSQRLLKIEMKNGVFKSENYLSVVLNQTKFAILILKAYMRKAKKKKFIH